MLSIAILVTCLALMFCYRALEPARHPNPQIAKRFRVGIAAIIMVFGIGAGYSLPVEVARGLQRMSHNQMQAQDDRAARKFAAEERHLARMIELFGSADRYLDYLAAKK